jgi:hypothetical protein
MAETEPRGYVNGVGCGVSEELVGMLRTTHIIAKDTHNLLSTMASAQSIMSSAATSMASTQAKAEARYEKLEDRLQEANDKAAGRGQIPIITHLIIMVTTVLITILFVLSFTNQTLEGTTSSVKVGQGK